MSANTYSYLLFLLTDLESMLQEAPKEGEREPLTKAKLFYQKCMSKNFIPCTNKLLHAGGSLEAFLS